MMKVADFRDSILTGDSTFILRQMPPYSIDLAITSPPYYRQRDDVGIGNEGTIDAYLEALLDTFRELLRVVKPTGNIVYNLGDKYLHRSLALVPYRFAIAATERFRVSLVNDITWVKRNPTPRQFTRRLVSSTEPFFHFVKGEKYYYDRPHFLAQNDNGMTHHAPTNNLGELQTLLPKPNVFGLVCHSPASRLTFHAASA